MLARTRAKHLQIHNQTLVDPDGVNLERLEPILRVFRAAEDLDFDLKADNISDFNIPAFVRLGERPGLIQTHGIVIDLQIARRVVFHFDGRGNLLVLLFHEVYDVGGVVGQSSTGGAFDIRLELFVNPYLVFRYGENHVYGVLLDF